MRLVNRSGLLLFLVALAAVLLLPSTALAGGDSPWSFEVRASLINPVKDDGGYVSDLDPSRTGTFDLLDVLVPELAVSYQATDRFAVEAALLLANMDMELDSPGAGELYFGDTDLQMISLSGLYTAFEWGNTQLKVGLSIALADFDDIDISPAAEADGHASGVQLTRAPGDSAFIYGIAIRFDTPFGDNGWYFSSNLRYLMGGPDLAVFGTPYGPAKLAGESRVLAGTMDFDPLIVSMGIGYRY